MFGIDWMAVFNEIDSFGKEHWGFILVMFAISYFLRNLLRSTLRVHRFNNSRREQRRLTPNEFFASEFDNDEELRQDLSGTSFGNLTNRPPVGFTTSSSGRRDLSNWTDHEIASQLSRDRFNRLNDLRGYMQSGD